MLVSKPEQQTIDQLKERPAIRRVPQKASDNKEDIDWERIIDSFKVGMKVKHNNFGEGEVVWVDSSKKYFRVKFTGGEKPFVFPNAFEQGYLTL